MGINQPQSDEASVTRLGRVGELEWRDTMLTGTRSELDVISMLQRHNFEDWQHVGRWDISGTYKVLGKASNRPSGV